MTEGLTINTF